MNQLKNLAAASFALVLLAACGSSGLGDVLGTGNGSPQQSAYEIRGTVDSVDVNSRSVYLTNVSGYTSMLSNGGNSVRVYYDDRTPVDFQGKTYRPQDLERGDQVSVRVDESGNALTAESMTVLYDASGGGTSGSSNNGGYASTMTGTVRYIDTSRRTIEIDRGYGSVSTIEYETNTPVSFNNQTYRVADLERGDEISVRVSDYGSGRYMAQDIVVTRSVSGNGGGIGSSGSSTQQSTIRGTVRYVDTSRRTIELESATWSSGFDSGNGNGSTVVISYDNNTGVDVQGKLYPVDGLERGDVVEVQVDRSGSSLFANRIFLIRDISR